MADELTIDGKQYISSKRASELSRYTQDYVGQLARGGHIDAQRIGGLWYVNMESLLGYKKKADEFTPQPPQKQFTNTFADSVVTFEGKDYISASRAAEITGYHQDYIGQLARSGKIHSRQIGTRWYVDRVDLINHKQEKDSLLGAVQSESVGIRKSDPEDISYEQKIEHLTPFRYITDSDKALMPDLKNEEQRPVHARSPESPPADDDEVPERPAQALPIRVIPERKQNVRPAFKSGDNRTELKLKNKSETPRNTNKYIVISGGVMFAVIVLAVGSFIYYAQPNGHMSQNGEQNSITTTDGSTGSGGIFDQIGNTIEPYVTKELIYMAN